MPSPAQYAAGTALVLPGPARLRHHDADRRQHPLQQDGDGDEQHGPHPARRQRVPAQRTQQHRVRHAHRHARQLRDGQRRRKAHRLRRMAHARLLVVCVWLQEKTVQGGMLSSQQTSCGSACWVEPGQPRRGQRWPSAGKPDRSCKGAGHQRGLVATGLEGRTSRSQLNRTSRTAPDLDSYAGIGPAAPAPVAARAARDLDDASVPVSAPGSAVPAGSYQNCVPGPPLKGPVSSGVIQPP